MTATVDVASHRRVRSGAPQLRWLFAYRVISRAYFHLPVLFVFLYLHGYSVITIELLLALYGVAILGSGPIVSKLSAALEGRGSLVAGELIKAAGLLLIGFIAGGLPGLVVGQLLSGFGYALTSSVEAGLVGAFEPDPAKIGKIQSSTQAWIFAMVMASGILGAVLFTHNRLSVFLLSVAACLVAGAAATAVRTPGSSGRAAAGAGGGGGGGAGAPAPQVALPRSVRMWIGYYIAIRSVSLACFVGIIPYLLFVRVHVTLAVFGAVLAGFNLAAFIVAKWMAGLVGRISESVLVGLTLGCVALSLSLFAASTLLVPTILAIILLGLGAGAARPLVQQGLAPVPGPSRKRTSIRMEQLTGTANAAVLALSGVALTHLDAWLVLVILAAAVAVVGAGFLTAGMTRQDTPAVS